MAKTKQKTNVEFLRDILKEFELHDSVKADEAMEFLDSIENEIELKDDRIIKLESENEENEDRELCDETVELGLDTLHYKLANGNLKIKMQLEKWVDAVQRQNVVVPS